MTLDNATVQSDPDLIYEPGVPVDNRMHAVISFENLALPLMAYFKRTGFRAVVGANCPVAYERGREALGPDVWVVNGGEDRGQEGWVPWKEGGLTPTLIVEMLSKSTEHRDRGEKKRIYQDVFKTIDYFLFQSQTGGVEAYRLKNGVYVRVHADRHGRFRCASLPLSLGVVDGRLRWFERNGHMLLTLDEVTARAAAERESAQQLIDERQQLVDERQQLELENRRLREELRRLRGGC